MPDLEDYDPARKWWGDRRKRKTMPKKKPAKRKPDVAERILRKLAGFAHLHLSECAMCRQAILHTIREELSKEKT